MEQALSAQMTDLKNKVEVDDHTLEERIQLAVDKVHTRLQQKIEGAILDYHRLVQETNKLLKEKFE